jgi:hypothetical protein
MRHAGVAYHRAKEYNQSTKRKPSFTLGINLIFEQTLLTSKGCLMMDISLSIDTFEPFWVQLHRNMGYSKHYQRFVIVEPLSFLIKEEHKIKCVPVEPIVYPQVTNLGENIAAYIDHEWGDCIEQVLVFSKKYNTILLTDEELIFQKQRIPEMLIYLKEHPKIAERVLGLVHYHIDEPKLSHADIEAINYFTTEIKSMGGSNQMGIVVSEANPQDTLNAYEAGKSLGTFLSSKLKERQISLSGCFFSGYKEKPVPLDIKLEP